jgi:hypothetical protein
MIFFSMFHTSGGYEILGTCTLLTWKQEYGEAHSICTLKNGFFGLQNSAVPFRRTGKKRFLNFECYDIANGEE